MAAARRRPANLRPVIDMQANRRSSRPSDRKLDRPRRLAPVVRWGLWTAAALLVVGHVALLARRVADASIAEPLVLVRWLASAASIAAVVELRRRGLFAWQGRTGLAFLLVVLLLHAGGGAPLPIADASSRIGLPAGLLAAAAASLALAFARPAAILAAAPKPAAFRPARDDSRRAVDDGVHHRPFASRPPPFAVA